VILGALVRGALYLCVAAAVYLGLVLKDRLLGGCERHSRVVTPTRVPGRDLRPTATRPTNAASDNPSETSWPFRHGAALPISKGHHEQYIH
jgi:hypothetical protein